MNKYKGVSYRVIRSSFNTINAVIVFTGGKDYSFSTLKQAKMFINELA